MKSPAWVWRSVSESSGVLACINAGLEKPLEYNVSKATPCDLDARRATWFNVMASYRSSRALIFATAVLDASSCPLLEGAASIDSTAR